MDCGYFHGYNHKNSNFKPQEVAKETWLETAKRESVGYPGYKFMASTQENLVRHW